MAKHPPSHQQRTVVSQQLHVGPLPPAAELAALNNVVPGLAERLVLQMEKEGNHRRDLELKQVVNESAIIQARVRVLWLSTMTAAFSVIVPLGATIFFISKGMNVESAVAFLTACGVIYSGRKKPDEKWPSQTSGGE